MQAIMCPFCMTMVQTEVCPRCGKSVSYTGDPMHLQVGYVLNGARPYVLGASLGQGGFGITYIALDVETNRRVAIKEYFPTYCAGRSSGVAVASYRGQEEIYFKGKERFLDEARTLKSLSDLSSVVNVLDFFESNNTAYLVMEFLEGKSLKDYVERYGRIPAQQFLKQLKPLMADMEKMHQRGVIHRDIAPDNIIMLPDGRLKLIDFGAARSYLGDKSMTVVVKKGFAPVEQYMRKGGNASTDIYALAATIYYCITGIIPPDSAERQYGEAGLRAPTELGAELTYDQELALEKALTVQPRDRTQSMAEVIRGLETVLKQPVPELRKKPAEQKVRKPQILQAEKKRPQTKAGTAPEIRKPELMPQKRAAGSEQKTDVIREDRQMLKWLIPAVAAVLALLVLIVVLSSGQGRSLNAESTGTGEDIMLNVSEEIVLPAGTVPAEVISEEASPEEETSEENVPQEDSVRLLTGDIFEEFSFNSVTGGRLTHIFGENLKIIVRNDSDVTVTITGLDMKDQYVIQDGSREDGWGHNWSVTMIDGSKEYVLSAVPSVPGGRADAFSMANTQGRLDAISPDGKVSKLKNASFSYTKDSITWQYTMDDRSYLDFRSVDVMSTTVKDPSLDLNLEYTYQRNDAFKLSDLDPTAPSLVVNQDSDVQQLIEEELSFKSDWITPIQVREGGYIPNMVQILDRAVNNCRSLTAEITVEEGNPEEFIVYIQDIDRWREAGRITSSGEKKVIGTVSFDEPTGFNAFAIVPAEGNEGASISYKLIAAQIYGYGLQSSGRSTMFTGEDLVVKESSSGSVSVTLSGLSLQDELPSKVEGPKGTEEYRWCVSLTSGNHRMIFQTDCPVPVVKYNQAKTTNWKEMKHTFVMEYLEFGEDENHYVKQAQPTVNHTADSITWTFSLDKNHPFDFGSGIVVEVNWFDRANGMAENRVYFGR